MSPFFFTLHIYSQDVRRKPWDQPPVCPLTPVPPGRAETPARVWHEEEPGEGSRKAETRFLRCKVDIKTNGVDEKDKKQSGIGVKKKGRR